MKKIYITLSSLFIMIASLNLSIVNVKAATISKDMINLANTKAQVVASVIVTPEMDDYSKAVAVHDWICANSHGSLIDKATDHSIVGPLLLSEGCCEGYAETFHLFMKILGVKSRRVEGWAGGGYHEWNEVLINGQYMAIDCMWDDPVIVGGPDPGGVYSRQYCLISPVIMALDHSAVKYY